MVWIGCVHFEKIRRDFVARTFARIAPVRPVMHRLSCSNEMVPNTTKHEFGVQWSGPGHDFVKQIAPVQLVLHRLSCSDETARNAPKHELMVQWGGSGCLLYTSPSPRDA